MKNTITLVLLIIAALTTRAQDIITMKSGDDIKAKVLEVNQTDIKYRRFESPDGATYTISKDDVLMIRYSDGTKDLFNTRTQAKTAIKEKPAKPVREKKERNKRSPTDNVPSGYIVAGGGGGFPVGSFMNTDASTTSSGFAMTGWSSFLEFAMPIARSNFGFAVNIGYYSNPFNTEQYNVAWNESNPTSGNLYNWQSDPYTTSTVMAGAYITIPIKRISFDFKALAGMAFCTFPNQTVYAVNTTSSQYAYGNNTTNTVASFAYGGNVAFRFAIVKHFCVMAEVGVVSTTPKYTVAESAGTTSQDVTFNQPTIIVNAAAGVGFQF